jgi:two-component system response regulator CssR
VRHVFNIYIVDDEKDILKLTKRYLEKEGYAVRIFQTGQGALAAVNDDVHLWLLDIMLEGDVSGYDIIKEIKKGNPVPVIFISARSQEFDRIMGLEMGSDDYIPKPFSMRELLLRVNNVINRVYGETESGLTHYGEYSIDVQKRRISKKGVPVDLTSTETDMVICLVENQGVALTRERLLDLVWGPDYFGCDRVVDNLVKRIREKMPGFDIETIYGYGYRLS